MTRPRRGKHIIRLVRVAPLQQELLDYLAKRNAVKEQAMPQESAPTEPTRKVNRLEQKQYYQLYKWLESRIGGFTPGVTQEEVAALASTGLGFEVTLWHIRGALETCGMILPTPEKDSDRQLRELKILLTDLITVPGAYSAESGEVRALDELHRRAKELS